MNIWRRFWFTIGGLRSRACIMTGRLARPNMKRLRARLKAKSLKRQFVIHNGEIKVLFDTGVTIGDERGAQP